jgi:hypothetical protein
VTLQQRAHRAVPGEHHRQTRIMPGENRLERPNHPGLRIDRPLPALRRHLGLGEERIGKPLEPRRGNETGIRAIVFPEVFPSFDRRARDACQRLRQLQSLGFVAGNDSLRRAGHPVVRESFCPLPTLRR